jgi:hypothetical protein
MALITTAGTETLRSHLFHDCDNSGGGRQTLIFGEAHHIYTVLSIIIHCNALNATTDKGHLFLKGHDGHAGTSGAELTFASFNIPVGETFVFNDKFSFNGVEPTGTNVLSVSEQTAIAGQTGSAIQELKFKADSATDDFDIIVTYIDQNNA